MSTSRRVIRSKQSTHSLPPQFRQSFGLCVDTPLIPSWLPFLCWLLLFLVLCSPFAQAEREDYAPIVSSWQPEVTWFTSKEGLPTSMIFKVIEDRRGYIWLATNNGAVCYDGHTFQTFTTRDGLINNTILDMFEDDRGRIWFLSLSKKLCYFYNERIYNFAGNKALDSTLETTPASISLSDDGSMIVVPLQRTSLIRCRNDSVSVIHWQDLPNSTNAHYRCSLIGNRWITWTDGMMSKTSQIVSQGKEWYRLNLLQKEGETGYWCQRLRNGILLAVSKFRMIAFDKTNRIVFTYESPEGDINSAMEDSKGDLWLLMRNGAIRYQQGDVVGSKPEHFLPGTYITSVLCDRSGNYWFSSWDNGLLCIPGIQFQSLRTSLSRAENSFSAVKIYKNQLWFLNTRGSIFTLQGDSVPILYFDGPRILAPVSESVDFQWDNKNRLWVGQHLHAIVPLPGHRFQKKKMNVYSAKVLCPLRNGQTAVGSANGFFILEKDSIVFNSSDTSLFEFVERTTALYEDADGLLWMGTISGLYRYDGISIRDYGKIHPLFRNRIVAIAEMPDGTMVLGTQGAGVLFKHGESVQKIAADSGLASDIVRSIYAENDSLVWVGTNKGLSRIVIRNRVPLRYEIVNFTTTKGLPSNAINYIVKHHGFIWLATDDGICRFISDSIGRNMHSLPTEITDVSVNGDLLPLQSSYDLAYNQNNISISFIGIGFRTFGDIHYRYRLLGLGTDTSWHETTNRNIPFLSLPPGTYTFQLSSINEDGIWNPKPKELRFRIVPHYTQTLWFRIGILAIALLALAFIVWRIIDNRRKKYTIEAQISELRQRALSANMNPHFISNALSVVQDYVLRHNAYEANEFLARFSRLIRLNLETSLSSFVSLEEELERLELYLSLEKLRFGTDMDYRITLDNEIDPDETLIPSMLVQPYVENAIWHGILPAERAGLVEVEIAALNQNSYSIVVRDNGVGISHTNGNEESERKSLSMELNRERLNLLSKSLKQQFSITISERLDTLGHPCGTIVRITLPRNIHIS